MIKTNKEYVFGGYFSKPWGNIRNKANSRKYEPYVLDLNMQNVLDLNMKFVQLHLMGLVLDKVIRILSYFLIQIQAVLTLVKAIDIQSIHIPLIY